MADTDATLKHADEKPNPVVHRSSFRDLFAFTRPRHVVVIFCALATSMLVAGGRTTYAVLLGKVFEVVAQWGAGTLDPEEFQSQITQWSVYFVLLGAAMWLVCSVDIALWVVTGELRARTAREILFSSLLGKSTAWYDLRMDGMASLMVGVHTQTRELQMATSQTLGFLLCDVFVFFACITVAFVYSYKLTFVMLATGIPSVLILWGINRFLDPAIEGQKRELAEASKHASSATTGIDLVKLYNGSDNEAFRFMSAIRRSGKYYMRQVLCNCGQMSYIKLWMLMLFVVGFFFAVVLVNNGDLTPGNALTTFYAALIAFQSVETLGPQWLIFVKGMVASQLLKNLAHDSNGFMGGDKDGGWYAPLLCQGNIYLRNVSFAYPSNPNTLVLHPSSFHFPPGEITFVVGKSGSGKSTLGNLLARFYEPLSGSITLDEHPLSRFPLKWLRRNITLVQQSSVTFSGSFIQNVALGALDPYRVTVEEVQEACGMALLQSTIAGLPEGIYSKIGRGCCNLSGGQQQRLALARAKLRDPPVLILDEITSGLDPVSRTLIMDAIRMWRKGKTTIIITHEVAQIQDAEYVYVLENGSIVQQGYRSQLIQLPSGRFASYLYSSDDTPTSANPDSNDNDSDSDDDSGSEFDDDKKDLVQEPPYDKIIRSLSLNKQRRSGLFHRMTLSAEPAAALISSAHVSRSHSMKKVHPQQEQPSDTIKEYVPYLARRVSGSMNIVTQTALEVQKARTHNGRRPAPEKDGAVKRDIAVEKRVNDSFDSLELFFLERRAKGKAEMIEIPRNKVYPSLLSILRTVWPTLDKAGRCELVLGIALCLVVAASNPAFSFIFSQLLSTFWLPENRQAASSKWAIGLTTVAVLDAVATFFAYLLMERVAQKWVNALRAEVFKRILMQPKAWFDKSNHSPARIAQCLERNGEEMRKLVGMFVPIFLIVTSMILAALTWALAIRWDLTLVTLAGIPVAIGAARANSMVSDKWESICDKAATATSAIFAETFSHIKVVRAMTLETYFTTQHDRSAHSTYQLGIERAVYMGMFYGLYQSTAFFLTAMVFYYAAKILKDGVVTTTDVIRIVNLLLFSLGTAVSLLGNLPQVAAAKITAIQMLYYANLSHTASHEAGGSRRVTTPLPVQMNNLRFAYPSAPTTQVLRNISLQIDPGTCTAIVGTSGCGKSTIASLLLRLYEPLPAETTDMEPLTYSGLDNTPASSLSTAALRSHMGYVPQHPFLFPVSVRDNISYGLDARSHAHLLTDDNIEAAARAADIHDFICSLPEGYNTLLGDGGIQVSGGQAQRLSIARALVRKPKLLVLDEPTSALDAESAEGVRYVIRSLVLVAQANHGKDAMAVVVITHSKEMMRVADRVVVVDHGVVVEAGVNGYDELVGRGGKFAQLVGLGLWTGGVGGVSSPSNDGVGSPLKVKKGKGKGISPVGEEPGEESMRRRNEGVSSAEWYALYEETAASVDADVERDRDSGVSPSSSAGKANLVDERALRRLEGLSPTSPTKTFRSTWEVKEDGEL